ncbi:MULTISPECIES: hypothetical protein [Halorubrum]|nr:MULTISPECIES: hypothetical protein [Halorubrum]
MFPVDRFRCPSPDTTAPLAPNRSERPTGRRPAASDRRTVVS